MKSGFISGSQEGGRHLPSRHRIAPRLASLALGGGRDSTATGKATRGRAVQQFIDKPTNETQQKPETPIITKNQLLLVEKWGPLLFISTYFNSCGIILNVLR